MDEKRKKLFSDEEFDKVLNIGDELVFDKPELRKLRIDLTWAGNEKKKPDLDICAFLLGKDGMIHKKEDLVYFGSRLRWKTSKDFNDPDFNPLEGKISTWPDAGFHNPRKWMEATLPISKDGSVIGSWDDMPDGDDDGDDYCGETMHVLLDEVDTGSCVSIQFAAAVAKRDIAEGYTFADAHDPIVTIYNADTEEQIAEYKLAGSFPGKDAVCFARMEFNEETFLWNFIPMGEGYNGGIQFLATEVFN